MTCTNRTCVFALAALAGIATLALVRPAFSSDDTAPDASTDAMMQQWIKANAPGKEHAMLLKNMVGSWDAKTTFWAAPGAPAVTSQASAEVSPMFGGRFVEVQYTGDMMGQPFHGRSFVGFNNATKGFQSIWFDSSSTGMMVNTGSQSSDNSLTWTGSYADPIAGTNVSTRSVDTFANGTWTFEMFETGSDGTERKSMEIVYTRKPANASNNELNNRAKNAQQKIESMNSEGR
jgi:hypothetical protein